MTTPTPKAKRYTITLTQREVDALFAARVQFETDYEGCHPWELAGVQGDFTALTRVFKKLTAAGWHYAHRTPKD